MGNRRSILLYPFSLLYGLITSVRNLLFDAGILKSHKFNIPVICVGNLTSGGTGKTPFTEYLAGLLGKKLKVAILSRGYKRRSLGFKIATLNSTVTDIGDEPVQYARKFPYLIVAVDRSRKHGIGTIISSRPDTEVIIMDDAFQHRRVKPGLSILLSDYDRPVINDHMLPYGNLRECKKNIQRADIIVITKSPQELSSSEKNIINEKLGRYFRRKVYFTSVTYKDPVPIFDDQPPGHEFFSASMMESAGIVLVTGIANPFPLKEYLLKSYREIRHLQFGDHHRFNLKDIERIRSAWDSLRTSDKFIFTTEKDAARLREFSNIAEPFRSAFYFVPIGIHFLFDAGEEFDNQIIEYAGKNK